MSEDDTTTRYYSSSSSISHSLPTLTYPNHNLFTPSVHSSMYFWSSYQQAMTPVSIRKIQPTNLFRDRRSSINIHVVNSWKSIWNETTSNYGNSYWTWDKAPGCRVHTSGIGSRTQRVRTRGVRMRLEASIMDLNKVPEELVCQPTFSFVLTFLFYCYYYYYYYY